MLTTRTCLPFPRPSMLMRAGPCKHLLPTQPPWTGSNLHTVLAFLSYSWVTAPSDGLGAV